MRAVTDRFLQAADGLRLHIASFGGDEGPPLLFIHGSFGHARVWDFVVSYLPPQRRAVAMDLPGHGDPSHAPHEERYAFEHLVEDIRCVVELIGGKPVLAGHSVGSALAMLCGAAFPGLLSGAVLMDIDPRPPDRQPQHLNDVGRSPPRSYPSMALAAAREARIAPAASPAVQSHLALHGYRLTDAGYTQKFDQAFLRSVRTWDARELLPGVTIPALVLRGGDSTVMSDEGYRDLIERLPNVRGETVFGATHQLHLDMPKAVAAAIESFVAGLR